MEVIMVPADMMFWDAPRTKTDSIHLRAARRSKRLPRSDMTGAAPEWKKEE